MLGLGVFVPFPNFLTQPFPMSPRNSADAVISMLEKTSCHRIISQGSLSPLISEVRDKLAQKQYLLKVDELLTLPYIFPTIFGSSNDKVQDLGPYPYNRGPRKPEDIIFYIHSSGSTGFPKPIPFFERIIRQWCNNSRLLIPVYGYSYFVADLYVL